MLDDSYLYAVMLFWLRPHGLCKQMSIRYFEAQDTVLPLYRSRDTVQLCSSPSTVADPINLINGRILSWADL